MNLQAITAVIDALIKNMDLIRLDDYVCLNIANSSVKLFNDF